MVMTNPFSLGNTVQQANRAKLLQGQNALLDQQMAQQDAQTNALQAVFDSQNSPQQRAQTLNALAAISPQLAGQANAFIQSQSAQQQHFERSEVERIRALASQIANSTKPKALAKFAPGAIDVFEQVAGVSFDDATDEQIVETARLLEQNAAAQLGIVAEVPDPLKQAQVANLESQIADREADNAREDKKLVADAKDALSADVFKNTKTVIEQAAKTPAIKDFREVQSKAARVYASNDDAAGDISLIFSFMKILDPTSVVRESEQATAANAAGVPERTRSLYNKILTGERLAPAQRERFIAQTRDLESATREKAEEAFQGMAGFTALGRADAAAVRGAIFGGEVPKQSEKPKRLRYNPETGELE